MTSPARAVLYLRSSKDRSDVSIDAQRRELQELAQSKQLEIAGEYADVVLSAKDDRRPDFLRLRADLKAAGRAWSHVLLLDPARLSRNQYVAHWFTHDAKRFGVRIIYARMPEANPMVDIIVTPIMHAFAEYHSWESKQKGLAGMAENVRRGFRAGGRAPLGYALEHIDTGVMRQGKPVMKSRLVPDPALFQPISAFLVARAAGEGRAAARSRLRIQAPENTLVGVEWNALTYAGHTVWNVMNERVGGKYIGGIKRRPRAEWMIQRDTHPAAITEAEAEAILKQIETGGATYRTRAVSPYLFTGMLQTPEGRAWHGDDGTYRVPGRRISSAALDKILREKIIEDCMADDFVQALLRGARRLAGSHQPANELVARRAKIKKLDAQIRRFADLAAEATHTRAFIDRVHELERERAALESSMEELHKEDAERIILEAVSESDIRKILAGIIKTMDGLDQEALKAWFRELVERITCDPINLTCRIHYKIQVFSGKDLASPRRRGDIPANEKSADYAFLRVWRQIKVA